MPSLNYIGAFQFASLSRAPEAVRQGVEVEARSGVADVAIWRTGIRGEPFTVMSMVDVVGTRATADILYRNYEGAKGGNPVGMTQGGVIIASAKFVVLDVRLIENTLMSIAKGGLNNGTVVLRAEWTLQPLIL